MTTISDEKDNVQFKAISDGAFTFNIGVYGIDPAVKLGGRQFYSIRLVRKNSAMAHCVCGI
ncbi:MAG: hypothetical protein U0X75_10740 [Acidobacteriota bacterium]